MNNTHVPGLGIAPPSHSAGPNGEVIGDSVRHQIELDLPGGKTANIGLRIGLEGPADREARRAEFLQTVAPASLTEGLEREVAKLSVRWSDHTGFDKDGNPLMRVVGRERELLEMKLANRINALELAKKTRAQAEYVQKQMGSTPKSRTVVKELITSDLAWRPSAASSDCGTARCIRTHRILRHRVSDTSCGRPARA